MHNLIRGCNPQPGAWTTFSDEVVQIFDVEFTQGNGRVGRVCALDAASFTINAGLGGIKIKRLRSGRGPKVDAAEFIIQHGLKVGDRFGVKAK